MEKKEYIVYDYKQRSSVVGDGVMETLNEVYALSYPKPEKTFTEMCKDITEEAKKVGKEHDENYRLTYCEGKYQWPIDFFYMPQNTLEEIWANRKTAYGVDNHWETVITGLQEMLFKKPGFKEVYGPTKYSDGKDVRHYEDLELLKDVIGEEAANKVEEIIDSYKSTYKWGIGGVNQFAWGFLSTPNCNRDTVTKAWKEAFNIDIEIPSDSTWISVYDKEDLEEDYQ